MEAAEVMKLIGKIKNIDEHNVRRNAKNILQHKKTDEGLKMNMFLKELEERGTFIFKRKVKIMVTLMVFAVVAVMIAQAINLSSKLH